MNEPTQWERINDFWERQATPYKCFYCGSGPLVRDRSQTLKMMATIDHYIPKCKRGSSSFKKNGVIACWPCNQEKGRLMPDEWILVLNHRRQKKSPDTQLPKDTK